MAAIMFKRGDFDVMKYIYNCRHNNGQFLKLTLALVSRVLPPLSHRPLLFNADSAHALMFLVRPNKSFSLYCDLLDHVFKSSSHF